MNWFNKLYFHNPNKTPPENKPVFAPDTLNDSIASPKPVYSDHKKLSPTALSYTPDPVIFKRCQKANSVFHLLKANVDLIDIELLKQIAGNRFFTSFSNFYRKNNNLTPDFFFGYTTQSKASYPRSHEFSFLRPL